MAVSRKRLPLTSGNFIDWYEADSYVTGVSTTPGTVLFPINISSYPDRYSAVYYLPNGCRIETFPTTQSGSFWVRVELYDSDGNLMARRDSSNVSSSLRYTMLMLMSVPTASGQLLRLAYPASALSSQSFIINRAPASNQPPEVYIVDSFSLYTNEFNLFNGYTDKTLYEEFFRVSGYSINFVTNGGTPVSPITSQTNLPDPLPATTRDGFAFTGWYTDSSLTFPAIPGAEISEDTTLYAGWRPNQFTVTFEANGGEPVGQLTNVNHLPDPLPTTLKVGNDFAGWFTDSELLHPAVPGAFISQNTTLYAKWVEQQSTDIHVPTVSTPSLLQTGFVTMWNPTLEEVRELSNFLWTTNLFDNLRKLFNDPMEAILFLGIVPFDVNTAERGNIYFGNLDTDVESTPIVQQYYTLDFGDIDMTEYYHSFLDYEPATTVEIFLPFCGTHKLSANEVMGSVMNLKYNVDVFTGTCVAMLTITKPGIDSVMYSFEGNLMATIPVTAKNYSDFIRSVVGSVALVGAML